MPCASTNKYKLHTTCSYAWMGGWVDGWVDGWMDGLMGGLMGGRVVGWMGGWVAGGWVGWRADRLIGRLQLHVGILHAMCFS